MNRTTEMAARTLTETVTRFNLNDQKLVYDIVLTYLQDAEERGADPLKDENGRLRTVVSTIASHVGAVAKPESSLEFMELVPAEVKFFIEAGCGATRLSAIQSAWLAVAKDDRLKVTGDNSESLRRWHTLAEAIGMRNVASNRDR